MAKTTIIAGRDPIKLQDYCLADLADVTKARLGGALREDPVARSFVIVPEALKADLEKRYLARPDVNGLMLAEILSFHRLAYRIFAIAGGLMANNISPLGKSLLLQKIIYDRADSFKYFQRFAGKPGYTAQLETVLTDLKRFDFQVDDLKDLVDQAPPSLTRDKLADFARLEELYQEELGRLGLFDQEDNLDRLADLLVGAKDNPDLAFLKRSQIWITGFADIRTFNRQELRLIALLADNLADLKVTVCCDPLYGDPVWQEIYEPGYRSYRQLKELLPGADLIQLKQEPEPAKFALQQALASSMLSFPELDSGRQGREKQGVIGQGTRVRLIAARDSRQEWTFIAGEIKRLVREEGYRRREVGLALADSNVDYSLVKSVFREFDLALYINDRMPLKESPLYHYLEGFFRLAGQSFKLSDLVGFFRTGLAEPSLAEVDSFENICLEYGLHYGWQISQSASYDRISGEEEKLGALQFKTTYIDPLLAAGRELKKLHNGRAKALYTLRWLAREDFRQGLEDLVDRLRSYGEEDIALSLARSWEIVIQVLEESSGLFDQTELEQAEFTNIVMGSLSGQVPSSIPVGLDRVRLGSLQEMIYYDCRVLFICGTSQKNFPLAEAGPGFLQNVELDWMADRSGKYLPDYQKNQIIAGQFTAAAIFEGQKDQLYLSTNQVDQTEWARLFSLLMAEVDHDSDLAKALDLRAYSLGSSLQPDQGWLTEERTRRFLQAGDQLAKRDQSEARTKLKLTSTGKKAPFSGGLPQAKILWQKALDSLKTDVKTSSGILLRDPLDRAQPEVYVRSDLNQLALSQQTYLSASSLETYQACPYQYFADYLLRLKERPVWEVDPRDRGSLVHSMMEQAMRELGQDLAEAKKPADRQAVLETWLQDLDKEDFYQGLYWQSLAASGLEKYAEGATFGNQGRRILRLVRSALYYSFAKLAEADFSPAYFEWSFPEKRGGRLDGAGQILLSESGIRLGLQGKIDRIDQNPQGFYKLYDYKTGEPEIDLQKIYHGLDLQLGLYQQAWQAGHPGQKPLGIGYLLFAVGQSKTKNDLLGPDEDLASRLLKQNLLKEVKAGPDMLEALGRHSLAAARSAVRELQSGRISARPRTLNPEKVACSYCPYQDICRFDQRTSQVRVEILEPVLADIKNYEERKQAIIQLMADQQELAGEGDQADSGPLDHLDETREEE